MLKKAIGIFSIFPTRRVKILTERSIMNPYSFIPLREKPSLKKQAAAWFHEKWGVPETEYLSAMDAYLNKENEYGWYLCLSGNDIVAGLGVIRNDFHMREDLYPNICAVYTEKKHRRKGIAGILLHMAIEDLRSKDISPVYLLSDLDGFYERYGFYYYGMAQNKGEETFSRIYRHD